MAVNPSSWKSLPMADREQLFDADDAILRMVERANMGGGGGDAKEFGKGFLWRATDGDPLNKDSYRLPIADVIDGKLTLVPHAVYAAAALLSGAHGGLPNVPDEDKEKIRDIISEIYIVLRDTFNDPRIRPPWDRGRPPEERSDAKMTALSVPVNPPRSWFDDPKLRRLTPLTIDDDGRIYGHLAQWGECHTGIGNACVTAPSSNTNYSYFKTGEVICDDGTRLAVGKITLGAGHADPALGYIPATSHYDSTASCVAVVSAGEDSHGIWVAGAAVPGLDDARVAELRRSPLSGDWRRVGGNLELIAALGVNVPGFPVVRASGGQQLTLLAAGAVTELGDVVEEEVVEETVNTPARGDRWAAVQAAMRTRRAKDLVAATVKEVN